MKWSLRVLRAIASLILLGISFTACTDREKQLTPFKPPTVAGYATPPGLAATQPTSTIAEVRPTNPPICADSLTFLEDITIPDGTLVNPGEVLDKRWLIKNSGSCNWNEGYRVRLVSGSELGASGEQALYPARSESEVSLRMIFTAPQEAGYYQSAWQAFNPRDIPFGDPFFIEIQVDISASQP